MSYKLIKSTVFTKKTSKILKSNPELFEILKQKLQDLSQDPFTHNLRTHRLKGQLSGSYACSLNYNYRIIFKVIFGYKINGLEQNVIFLETIGTHDEVY